MNLFEKSLQFVVRYFKPDVFSPDKSWEKVTGQHKRILYRPTIWWSVVAVAVAIVGVVTGIIFLHPAQEKTITAYEIQKITVLPDESIITLAPGAMLSYAKNFGKNNREVNLIGAAGFEVHGDEILPFTIQTSSVVIVVLGTVFDVNAMQNRTVLKVQSGKVQINPKDFPVSFTCIKDMKAEYNFTEKEVAVSSRESSCVINQKSNRLRFYNMRLAEVCRILEQYYNQSIQVADEDKGLRLTSTFENKTVDEIIDVVNLTLDTNTKTE